MEIRVPTLEEIKQRFPWSARILGIIGTILWFYEPIERVLGIKSTAEEAVSTVHQVSPMLGLLFSIALSPFFGMALIGASIAYSIFVPVKMEPSRGLKIANIVAWGACIISFLMLWTVLVGGYVAFNSANQPDSVFRQQVVEFEASQWPRLNARSQSELESFLKGVPIPQAPIFVTFSDGSGVGLARDLTAIFSAVGWPQMPVGGSIDAQGATGLTIQAKPGDITALRLRDGLARVGLNAALDFNTQFYGQQRYMIILVIGIRI